MSLKIKEDKTLKDTEVVKEKVEKPATAKVHQLTAKDIAKDSKFLTEEEASRLPTPFVVWKGKQIHPTKTVAASEHNQPYFLPVGDKKYTEGVTLTHFHFFEEGRRFDLMLDEKSCFNNTELSRFYRAPSANQTTITLIDSKLVNCIIEDRNNLVVNVEANDCVFKRSSLIHERESQDYFYDYGNRPLRETYKEVKLTDSTVVNAVLPKGWYKEVNLKNCKVRCHESRYVNMRRITANNIDLSANNVFMAESSLQDVYINAHEELLVARQTLSKVNFDARAVNLISPFSFMEVQLPGSYFNLVQMNESEVYILRNSRIFGILKFDASSEEIFGTVKEMLETWPLNNKLEKNDLNSIQDPIIKSLAKYAHDTIRSRLRIISVMTSVDRLGSLMGFDRHFAY